MDGLSKNQRRRRNAAMRKQAAQLGFDPDGKTIEQVQEFLAGAGEQGPDGIEDPIQETVKVGASGPIGGKLDAVMDDEDPVEALLAEALRPRHIPIFEWMCEALGVSKRELVCQLLRASVMREKSGYTEAIGGGGASSKNLELLSERVPVKK